MIFFMDPSREEKSLMRNFKRFDDDRERFEKGLVERSRIL